MLWGLNLERIEPGDALFFAVPSQCLSFGKWVLIVQTNCIEPDVMAVLSSTVTFVRRMVQSCYLTDTKYNYYKISDSGKKWQFYILFLAYCFIILCVACLSLCVLSVSVECVGLSKLNVATHVPWNTLVLFVLWQFLFGCHENSICFVHCTYVEPVLVKCIGDTLLQNC